MIDAGEFLEPLLSRDTETLARNDEGSPRRRDDGYAPDATSVVAMMQSLL